ncbi:hypothetical protein ACL02S_17865 [Nocardia sp. 004]|uniref:AMIN-like domain-containing (lipo)protein n=1 Tax=Nocardia sp. 004 TaxID=3385978 RepID=UPI0039A057E9
MRRLLLLFFSLTLAGLWFTPSQAAASPNCDSVWGSLYKTNSTWSIAALTGVRTGRHACFDRVVFDLAGPITGYHVGYVERVVWDGSGALVPLRGGASLNIIVNAPALDGAGDPTYTPADRTELTNVGNYRTFRQVAWAGTFEGQTTIGLGVRARLPFQVFTLPGPGAGSRVVVDVAHSW